MTSEPDCDALATALAAVQGALATGRREPIPPELEHAAELDALLGKIAELYEFTLAISQGDLERSLTVKGSMAGALKTLHAALRHLTWQTQRVAAGDAVLVELAALLRAGIRSTDSLARWGGEEFVVLSPAAGLPATRQLAERLRETVGTHPFGPVPHVTASFGTAEYHVGDDPDTLFARADQALYKAKESGRDRVEAAD
ncbi:MAG: GGDEF domain-containing protein [Actinomycetes bacterium]